MSRRLSSSRPWRKLGAFAIAAMLALTLAAGAADQPQAARAEVGKPVQQAQALVRQKRYPQALAKLREADAVADKSPYEIYVIEETRAAATLAAADYPAAAKALEAVLATNILPAAEASKRIMTLAQVEYTMTDYAKSVDAANRYYKSGGSDPEPRRLMAQALYLENDFPNAAKTIRDVLRDDERTGKTPDENLLLTLASAEFKAKDQDGYIDAMERLAATHPKPQYWSELVRAVQEKPGFAPRLRLDLDRLAVATGAMTTPAQYVEAAELALAAGFPGDAKSFLDHGYKAGVLGKGAPAARQKRLADMAQHQSEADIKTLAQLRTEADAASDGLAAEKLGEAYASYGRYPDAIAAIAAGVAKGGLKHPDDAKLHLGVAYLRGGQTAKAKEVLQPLTGADGVQDLARLWLIEGGAG